METLRHISQLVGPTETGVIADRGLYQQYEDEGH